MNIISNIKLITQATYTYLYIYIIFTWVQYHCITYTPSPLQARNKNERWYVQKAVIGLRISITSPHRFLPIGRWLIKNPAQQPAAQGCRAKFRINYIWQTSYTFSKQRKAGPEGSQYIDGLAQNWSNSSALATELCQSCVEKINPLAQICASTDVPASIRCSVATELGQYQPDAVNIGLMLAQFWCVPACFRGFYKAAREEHILTQSKTITKFTVKMHEESSEKKKGRLI